MSDKQTGNSSLSSVGEAAAAGFDRPLLLTPRQDLMGFITSLAGRAYLTAVASVTILTVLLIFVFIIAKASAFFGERSLWELIGSKNWFPTHEESAEFGALSMFYGTGVVTLGAMLIAMPVGILAAVCLSDIVPFRVRQIIKPVVELLAAIPSVAFGFFAALVVAPWLQQNWGLDSGTNALNGSLILAFMAVHTIVSISEDALTAVGRDLREGAYALGCTRAEVLCKVVIPAAHSGIIAAVVLGVMRAVGETMAVWMATGMSAQVPTPWWNVTAMVRTLTATIAQEMGEAPDGSVHRHALFAIGLMLLVLTFLLNLVSEYFLSKAKRLARGKAK